MNSICPCLEIKQSHFFFQVFLWGAATFNLSVLSDDQIEGKEKIELQLESISGAGISAASPDHTVKIQDGDNVLSVTPAIYWINNIEDWIQRGNPESLEIEDLITTDINAPSSIAIDLSRNIMLWSDSQLPGIHTANLDGSGRSIILPELSSIQHLKLNSVDGKIYWTDDVQGGILRADSDGSNVETVVNSVEVFDLALETVGGKLYWSGDGKIQRANFDGSSLEPLVTSGVSNSSINPRRIVLEPSRQYIYWTSEDERLWRTNFDGTVSEAIFSGLSNVSSMELDPFNRSIYYVHSIRNSGLNRLNLVNLTVETELFSPIRFVSSGVAVASDGPSRSVEFDSAQSTVLESSESNHDIEIRLAMFGVSNLEEDIIVEVVDMETGTATSGADYLFSSPATVSFPAGASVVATETIQITILQDEDPEDRESISIQIFSSQGPAAVGRYNTHKISIVDDDVKPSNRQVYWINNTTNTIHRANLDFTGIREIASSMSFTDIAIDHRNGKLYWSAGDEKIQRSNLDGSSVENILPLSPLEINPVNLGSIAVDIDAEKMYWIDFNTFRRSNLDGTEIEEIIRSFGPFRSISSSLALDPASGKIYWITFELNSRIRHIHRADISGSNIETQISAPSRFGSVLDLDTVNDKIYWTNQESPWIQRANLDGSEIEDVISTGINQPTALSLDLLGQKMYWLDENRDTVMRSNLDGGEIEDVYASDAELRFNRMRFINTETPPIVEFLVKNSDVVEDQTTNHSVLVKLIIPHGNTLNEDLHINVRDTQTGSAQTDIDYSFSSVQLTFPRGSEDGAILPIEIEVQEDIIQEIHETVALEMELVQGNGVIGGKSNHQIRIVDNDKPLSTAKIYWTDADSGKIHRANLDMSEREDIVTEGISAPRDLELDVKHGMIYWIDNGIVYRATLEGDGLDVVFSSSTGVEAFTVDSNRDTLYVLDTYQGTNPENNDSGIFSEIWSVELENYSQALIDRFHGVTTFYTNVEWGNGGLLIEENDFLAISSARFRDVFDIEDDEEFGFVYIAVLN